MPSTTVTFRSSCSTSYLSSPSSSQCTSIILLLSSLSPLSSPSFPSFSLSISYLLLTFHYFFPIHFFFLSSLFYLYSLPYISSSFLHPSTPLLLLHISPYPPPSPSIFFLLFFLSHLSFSYSLLSCDCCSFILTLSLPLYTTVYSVLPCVLSLFLSLCVCYVYAPFFLSCIHLSLLFFLFLHPLLFSTKCQISSPTCLHCCSTQLFLHYLLYLLPPCQSTSPPTASFYSSSFLLFSHSPPLLSTHPYLCLCPHF